MNYVIVATAAYFFLAVSYVLDKFLLSDRIPKPSVYAFYVALLSFASLALVLFSNFSLQGFSLLPASLISGVVFVYAILFLYKAVKINEISRVAPLVGSVIVIASLIISITFLEDKFTAYNLSGIASLLIGGFLISFDLPIKSLKVFKGFRNSLLSGLLFSIAYIIFKHVYSNDDFINGFIWTRMGIFTGGLSLLLFSSFRKEIVSSLTGFNKNKKRNLTTGIIFIGSKIFGGGYSILMNYAIYLGSVAIINALSSIQFVFILVLASLASIKYPKLFGEKLFFWDWFQKVGAIVIISVGIALVSI